MWIKFAIESTTNLTSSYHPNQPSCPHSDKNTANVRKIRKVRCSINLIPPVRFILNFVCFIGLYYRFGIVNERKNLLRQFRIIDSIGIPNDPQPPNCSAHRIRKIHHEFEKNNFTDARSRFLIL